MLLSRACGLLSSTGSKSTTTSTRGRRVPHMSFGKKLQNRSALPPTTNDRQLKAEIPPPDDRCPSSHPMTSSCTPRVYIRRFRYLSLTICDTWAILIRRWEYARGFIFHRSRITYYPACACIGRLGSSRLGYCLTYVWLLGFEAQYSRLGDSQGDLFLCVDNIRWWQADGFGTWLFPTTYGCDITDLLWNPF